MKAKLTPATIVIEEVRKWLELKDDLQGVVPLVTAVANRLPGPPVWVMIVAPSSSAKSDLIMPIAALDGVHFISKVTDKTFVSGKKREQNDAPHLSLLERLKNEDKWLIAVKDFGTIQSLPVQTRNAIFGQLREIYDGCLAAYYGTGVKVEWEGKLGFLRAATPVIDKYSKWNLELGERFVQFRPHAPPRALVTARAWEAVTSDRDNERAEALASAYRQAFELADAASRTNSNDVVTIEANIICKTLVDLVIDARTPIEHDYGYQVGESEGSGRLTKVFAQLFRAANICYGGDVEAALRLVVRIGLDSMPGKRRSVMRQLARQPEGVSQDQLAQILRCDSNTAGRYCDDLVALGLAERSQPVKQVIYAPSQKLLNFAEAICLDDCLDSAHALQKLFDLPRDITPARGREMVTT